MTGLNINIVQTEIYHIIIFRFRNNYTDIFGSNNLQSNIIESKTP